ncbi:MerR family transcriptional regulator [Georgenia sp. Z1344]|uniref:transcriptional regulator FtsR n=1 Tax=Georgenia sp. Z1344 TaxID=3416706 RepID=UPI003CE97F8B
MSAARSRSSRFEPADLSDDPARPDGATGADGAGSGTTGSAGESWPPGVSRTPVMAIGQVVAILQDEFPAMTLSKLRYLEEQDLVRPHRAPSGYRKYSRADVERLRFALAAQRDAFLPLRVIRDQLDDLDAGRGVQDPVLARIVARDGQVVAPAATSRLTSTELADATGASVADVEGLAEAGLVPVDARGRHPGAAVPVVVAAAALGRLGVDPRHLRTVRQAAEREAGTIAAALAPLRAGRSGADLERANARAREMGELYAQLHTELLRRAISEL